MDFLTALLISTTIMASTLFTPTYGNGISTILTIKNCNIRNKFATENKLPLEEQAYPFKLDEYMGVAKLDKDGQIRKLSRWRLHAEKTANGVVSLFLIGEPPAPEQSGFGYDIELKYHVDLLYNSGKKKGEHFPIKGQTYQWVVRTHGAKSRVQIAEVEIGKYLDPKLGFLRDVNNGSIDLYAEFTVTDTYGLED